MANVAPALRADHALPSTTRWSSVWAPYGPRTAPPRG